MNTHRKLLLAFVALSILVIGSCAKAPLAEMEAANAAFTKADADADAKAYAPESLSKAKDIVSRMKTESDAKRYDAARSLAKEATEASEKAMRDGSAAKLKAKDDSGAAVKAAKDALAEVRKAFAAAKGVRRIKLDVKAVDQDVQDAAKGISAAEGDVSKSDYRAALAKAQTARTKLADVQQRISEAVRAATAKK
jgi:hypothetical protein